ncbi:Holliday junction branch migration protein RuvA [Limosilactobacillus fermentum]|uniref:Holliday junction branch migration protein RuvA n=1 Tax=Limosilactobacillus fermentum TaxID=1613 RepID=UPI0021A2BCDF|nr:Holliday junction branch migration protein RuvA [Limosilactobacillus fermentum]MCT3440021.1 Holliday junction branch migration protein RuvA [Limosilactobacillus fermentum]MCT3456408.1 Holliday junction branch migration protein RuvA [Limosilactobacillus fermentum]
MFEYLTGLITMVSPDFIVVDVNGVGYRVAVANPYAYQKDDQQAVQVFIYQAVKEDAITLFGFATQAEKRLFTQLIGVSGIGPKSALAILATPDHQGLIDAIQNGDDKYLSKFPGVGKKTASRIIIELKDKVVAVQDEVQLDFTAPGPLGPSVALQDALAALESLGYTTKQVERVQKQLEGLQGELSTNDYLSQGLKLLSR